jgi:hypothetical protein
VSPPEHLDADALDRSDVREGPSTHEEVALEPRWLRGVAFGSASAVASFGAVGLAAAVGGVYRSYLVFPLGAAVWIGVLLLARPILTAPGRTDATARVVSGAALVFVVGMSIWNARHAAQHILINRDGGSYSNAGRWIALHGNLRVAAAAGPFAHQANVTFGSFAMYPTSRGVLSFQFAHLLPALLAEAQNLGGDRLMFAATPLIGGVALLGFFVAAWRFLRNPYVALAAVVSFAFVLPEVSFSRDAYSEIPMQVLLFTALWILADRQAFRRPRIALVAGLVLGMLQAARIDGLVPLTGLGLLFAIMWMLADRRGRRSVALCSGACALGLIPGFALGATDVGLRANQYIRDLHGDVKQLGEAMLFSIVVALVVVAVVPPIARRLPRLPRWFEWAAAALVAMIGFGMWFVRPRLQHVKGPPNSLIGGLQQAAGVVVDPRRRYAERSLQWMSWYLGPITVAAAIVAAALLVRLLIRGRMRVALVGIALLAPASVVYLLRPNISTDQIWVMRRYLFSALPLFTLLAFGLVAGLLALRPERIPRVVPVVAALAIGAAGVVYPISTVEPVKNITEQRGDLLALRDACHIMGNHAAIVVLQSPTGLLHQWAPQSLRGWCNAPVGVMAVNVPDRAGVLTRLATQWSAAGRKLWVVADAPETIRAVFPKAAVLGTPLVTNPFLLERTVVRRPRHYMAEQFALEVAPVPATGK